MWHLGFVQVSLLFVHKLKKFTTEIFLKNLVYLIVIPVANNYFSN